MHFTYVLTGCPIIKIAINTLYVCTDLLSTEIAINVTPKLPNESIFCRKRLSVHHLEVSELSFHYEV